MRITSKPFSAGLRRKPRVDHETDSPIHTRCAWSNDQSKMIVIEAETKEGRELEVILTMSEVRYLYHRLHGHVVAPMLRDANKGEAA